MNEPKTILYVWKDKYPWDVRVEKICNSLVKFGFNVVIIARWKGEIKEKELIDGLIIRRVGFNKKSFFSTPISSNPVWKQAIEKAIEEYNPCLIIPREIMLGSLCGKLGQKNNIPVIMDMAENYPAAMLGFDKYYQNFSKRLVVHYLRLPEIVECRAVANCQGIITVCSEQNSRLIKEYNVEEDNLIVAHNTPKRDWFDDVRLGATKPPKEFAYHGHFSQDRNLIKLIIGFILAANQDKTIKLTMAGEGDSFDECVTIARNSKVNDRITFTGKYNHYQIKKFYSEMDIGLLPYKLNNHINYTISNKLFDYIAAGKPVIVSMATPMIRIIDETATGIYTDCSEPENISEAILKIKEMDFEKIKNNGLNAFNNKYNWDVDEINLINFIKKYL